MRLTKQDAIYAALGALSLFVVSLASIGALQRWLGLTSAESVFMLAVFLGALACKHALLLILVELSRRHVEPVAWLLRRSQPAIRAVLHLWALLVFAVGIAVGCLLGSNFLLILSVGLAAITSLATEWTFAGGMGPLATLLRAREREYLKEASSS